MSEIITPGVYELNADVPNPAADRRKKRDWRAQALWAKGMRLRVVEKMYRESRVVEGVVIPRVDTLVFEHPSQGHPMQVASRTGDDEWVHFDAGKGGVELTQVMVPVERNFDGVRQEHSLGRGHDQERAVLKWLVQEGKVSLDEVEVAYKMGYDVWDAIGEPDE